MTPFAVLRSLAGLSHAQAAELLGTREQQAKDMAVGRKRTPPGVLTELADLVRRQEQAARRILIEAEDLSADVVRLEAPASDEEARALGWPCLGAWGAVAGRVIAGSARPVEFSPLRKGKVNG